MFKGIRLTCGEESVKIMVSSMASKLHAAVFHHVGSRCEVVHSYAGKDGKLAPIGILFGFNDTKKTAKAEAVISFESDGNPVIDRKGLRVKVG